MPPSAEHPTTITNHNSHESGRGLTATASTAKPTTASNLVAKAFIAPSKNVTFAVNYELPMVDQFLAVGKRKRVDSVSNEALHPPKPSSIDLPLSRRASNGLGKEGGDVIPSSATGITEATSTTTPAAATVVPTTTTSTTVASSDEAAPKSKTTFGSPARRRVSLRDKQKRETPMHRTRVRYDMQLVPAVVKTKRLSHNINNNNITRPLRSSSHAEESTMALHGESVLWIPSKRSEWEDTVSEMTAVCTTAAIRRLPAVAPNAPRPPFLPPLSRDYIRDRVDIDDPLRGYQIRHKQGGWLQGFCLFTTFTTWTHGFHWDSAHAMSGMRTTGGAASASASTPPTSNDSHTNDTTGSRCTSVSTSPASSVETNATVTTTNCSLESDANCSSSNSGGGGGGGTDRSNGAITDTLAKELESLPRYGDPRGEGIVFQDIAEIALLGGLGCGEYLLNMALDQMHRDGYKFVVLQATASSKTFYERFGFVRVGAICHYGDGTEIVGYRHWTHANESEVSLQKHGGPSYMMCLRLSANEMRAETTSAMMEIVVDRKPVVEQLGATSSSTPVKPLLMNAATSATAASTTALLSSASSNKREDTAAKRRKSQVLSAERPNKRTKRTEPEPEVRKRGRPRLDPDKKLKSAKTWPPAPKSAKTWPPVKTVKTTKEPAKRGRKPAKASTSVSSPKSTSRKRGHRLENSKPPPTPPEGRPLSYAEKQYHSVWLAVPPKLATATSTSTSRRRASVDGRPTRSCTTASSSVPIRPITAPLSRPTSSGRGRPKLSTTKNLHTLAKSEDGKLFYSVRGPDGKFVRVMIDGTLIPNVPKDSSNSKSAKRSKSSKKSSPSTTIKNKMSSTPLVAISPERPSILATIHPDKPGPVDKKTLRKQKVTAYPRNRVHYFNRVVQRTSERGQYYFCLEYDDDEHKVCLIPMVARGTLSGKREGRPRYQCDVRETDANFIVLTVGNEEGDDANESTTKHKPELQVVSSAMVMKTPIVAQEAWDVAGPNDKNFETR